MKHVSPSRLHFVTYSCKAESGLQKFQLDWLCFGREGCRKWVGVSQGKKRLTIDRNLYVDKPCKRGLLRIFFRQSWALCVRIKIVHILIGELFFWGQWKRLFVWVNWLRLASEYAVILLVWGIFEAGVCNSGPFGTILVSVCSYGQGA
jgi:hypothetical protein